MWQRKHIKMSKDPGKKKLPYLHVIDNEKGINMH
jgi:hypothetical protein